MRGLHTQIDTCKHIERVVSRLVVNSHQQFFSVFVPSLSWFDVLHFSINRGTKHNKTLGRYL